MKPFQLVIAGFISVLLLLLVILTLSLVGGYNRLVDLDESLDASYAQVFNRLEQRHDTINQMVATISGLQEHEREIYELIISARLAYADAIKTGDIDQLAEADALESIAISQLLVAIEDNPMITVSSAFNGLLDTIYSMESTLSVARRDYNQAVLAYNQNARRFPGLIFVSLFGFESRVAYWKIDEGKTDVPEISFTN